MDPDGPLPDPSHPGIVDKRLIHRIYNTLTGRLNNKSAVLELPGG